MDPRTLAELLGDWGYATMLVLLCATGLGSPVPEDLVLAAAGYLISADVFSWPAALVTGILGVVASDTMLYTWGRRLRAGADSGWLVRIVSPQHLTRVERWLTRFGDGSVLVARLLPGTRAVAFMGAGLRRMPLPRFLVLDLAGALIWVPLILFAASRLGEEIGGLERLLARAGRLGGPLLAAALALGLLWRWWRAEESKL